MAYVREDGQGLTYCSNCRTIIECNKTGDMPEKCPSCGEELDYGMYKDPDFEEFTLHIRGGRDIYEEFASRRDLEEEVRQYLSPGEIKDGVLTRLTAFRKEEISGEGYAKRSWRNMTTCAYPRE